MPVKMVMISSVRRQSLLTLSPVRTGRLLKNSATKGEIFLAKMLSRPWIL